MILNYLVDCNLGMHKIQLTGRHLSQVFNYKYAHDCLPGASTSFTAAKLSNTNLKTRPKQLLGSLPLAFAPHGTSYRFNNYLENSMFTSEKFCILNSVSLGVGICVVDGLRNDVDAQHLFALGCETDSDSSGTATNVEKDCFLV
jgi:hypothetical protein